MKKKHCLMILAVLLFVENGSVLAKIYQWTDAQGNVHYSDVPNSQNAKPVNIKVSEPNKPSQTYQQQANNPTQNPPQQTTNSPTTATATATATTSNPSTQETQAKMQEVCQNSRDNLARLQETGRRVYRILPNGEYHWFNDEERQAEIERLKKQIKDYCMP
jgi:hypothetical protein